MTVTYALPTNLHLKNKWQCCHGVRVCAELERQDLSSRHPLTRRSGSRSWMGRDLRHVPEAGRPQVPFLSVLPRPPPRSAERRRRQTVTSFDFAYAMDEGGERSPLTCV
jgi:hypothetical protein